MIFQRLRFPRHLWGEGNLNKNLKAGFCLQENTQLYHTSKSLNDKHPVYSETKTTSKKIRLKIINVIKGKGKGTRNRLESPRGWRKHHFTRNNTPIHNILSTAQLSISQKALGTLSEDGRVMPKHVGATTHN
jgi:hypothetical protein